MRVRHFACVAPPVIGGIGKAALDEVQLLNRHGVVAELVVPARSGVTFETPIRSMSTRRAWGNAAIVRDLARYCQNTDLLHLHYPFFGVAEPLLLQTKRPPIVVTVHMRAMESGWRGFVFDAHHHLLQSMLLRRADRILVPSLDYAKEVSLSQNWNELSDRVIELPFFAKTPSERPTSLARRGWLFVGGLDAAHRFKGLSLLLSALKMLPGEELTVVGDGNERHVFEEEVRELGLETRVRFLGRISNEALAQTYAEHRCLVVPSTSVAEAFSLVAMEAQIHGLPVIASDLPGVRTVVRHEKTGWLVAPGSIQALSDQMRAVLTLSDDKWLETSRAAKQWAEERFSEASHASTLIRVYHEVCGSQ